jgi:putative membrane protein
MTATEAVTTVPATKKWKRLSPLTIIYFIVKFIKGLIQNGPQTLLPILAVIVAGGEDRWLFVGMIATGVSALFIVGAVLGFFRFRFRLTGDTVLIRSGVLKRKRLMLGFDRIQNITLKEPLYFRVFGLVVMDIESMGSSKVEVSLSGIPRQLAEGIRATVLAKRPEGLSPGRPEIPAAENRKEIIFQPTSELVRYGLSSNRIWMFAGIASGAIAQMEPGEIELVANWREGIVSAISSDTSLMVLFTVFGIISVIILLMLVSVTGAILTNHNYRITYLDERFHRTRGLFERQEVSLPQSRIQTIKIRQPWIARFFKRFQLHLNQIAFGRGSSSRAARGGKHFFIPSVNHQSAVRFSRLLYPDFDWPALKLKPIDRMFIFKKLQWVYLPISAIPAIISTVMSGSAWGLLPLVLLPVALPMLALRRVNYGYASDGSHGILRNGFVGHELTIFPFYKVQNVALSQSPAQKKARLASMSIKMASSTIKIPFMPTKDANRWRDMILYQVESSNRNWM